MRVKEGRKDDGPKLSPAPTTGQTAAHIILDDSIPINYTRRYQTSNDCDCSLHHLPIVDTGSKHFHDESTETGATAAVDLSSSHPRRHDDTRNGIVVEIRPWQFWEAN